MANKYVDLEDCYTPKSDDKDIIVDVVIGDGQSGSYSIFLGTKLINTNKAAKLGKKKNLEGKKTTISVTIVDELKETNWTSITVLVTEGDGKAVTFGPYKTQAENHMDTVIYTLKLIH